MEPPPITEISFKVKHRRAKSLSADLCTSDNDDPCSQTKEQEPTSPPQSKEKTTRRPPIPPSNKSTKAFPKKPHRRVKSLRRNRVGGVMSSRSVISSLTSWTGSRNSLMDDSTASELPVKPQDIFRAKPKPGVFRRKEPQAATPQRKSNAGAAAPVSDATPVRHNRGATLPNPTTPPPVVSETDSRRKKSPSIPLPASYSLSCNESMSTANSASIMGNMTKRAVDNVLDDFLFEYGDNLSIKSPIQEEDVDSYYGEDKKHIESSLVSSEKKTTGTKVMNDVAKESDRDSEHNDKESATIQSETAETGIANVFKKKVPQPEVETVLDDDSYFDRDMEVSSLVEDAMSTLEQDQGIPKDHWHFNVRSLRYKKNDKGASVNDTMKFDDNVPVVEQKDAAEANDGHPELEPAWDDSNVASKDSPSLVSHENKESLASYSGIASLRSNGNDIIGMPVETNESVVAAESTCSSFAATKPLPTPDQSDHVSLQSKKPKNLVVAVESPSTPWWQDGQDEETGINVNGSRAGGKTVKSIDPEEEPLTFRRTFMILFLIIGFAAITGGIAALVTSNHQKSQVAGDEPTVQVASPPRITPPPSPPTTTSPSPPVTIMPTTQPVAETILKVTGQPTVEQTRATSIPTSSPPTTNAPTALPATNDTTSPTIDHLKLSLYEKIELFSPESMPALDNATTAQARALNWTLQQTNPSLQHYSLATLFYESKSKWSNDAGWMTSSSVCEWYGIVCREGKVTEMTLSFNNLASTLPDELSLLTDLEVLSLSGAAGTGQVKGGLTGSIPSSWGKRMVNLVALELYDNQLSGELPISLQFLTDLEMLNVDGNKLFGPLPSEIGAMTSLEILDVSSNDFSGSIPTEFGLLTNLLSLKMSDSEFTGFLPTHLGNLKSMKEFHAQNNVLMGSIPKALYGLSELSWLDLSNNELDGILLPSIGLLSNAEGLLLDDNRLEGPIPVQLSLLTDLRVLTLAKNVLTGSIPDAICNMSLSEFTFSEDCSVCPCCKPCLSNNTV